MKKRIPLRLMALLLCLCTVFLVACSNPSNPNGGTTESTAGEGDETQPQSTYRPIIEPENDQLAIVPLDAKFYVSTDTVYEGADFPVYCFEGHTDIPMLEMGFVVEMLNSFMPNLIGYTGFKVTLERTGNRIYLMRENGSLVIINFDEKTLFFSERNSFFAMGEDRSILDIAALVGTSEDGAVRYLDAIDFWERTGDGITISFDEFSIPLAMDPENGKYYIPLQTVSDLLIAPTGACLAYNSKDVFFLVSGKLNGTEELYYSVEKKPMSDDLKKFNFGEMCMALQYTYGLQESHNINNGMINYLSSNLKALTGFLSNDATDTYEALIELTLNMFADLHSSPGMHSPYSGPNTPVLDSVSSMAMTDARAFMERYANARQEAFADGCPPYMEIGNTAYITLDSFSPPTVDYYEQPITEVDVTTDTFGLVIYAHARITRENSPIENVVLDLSNNGGGALDAAIYLLSWFLGTSTINLRDPIVGTESTVMYGADVNLDGEINEKDNISNLNLYCITSPCSFSCGNLVPATFKASDKVTLLGEASQGGACAVGYLTTANGCSFALSSSRRLSSVINGSFYDIDTGVEPDYKITKLENFYNRERLTEIINNELL